tara:strand:+ start:143 stop:970 length:828 start_codon:yes stop_codon:yes gene_type:complete
MILWLSSYPKSGNTWARIFLINYLFEETEDPFINLGKINSFPRKENFQFLEKKDFESLQGREQNFKYYIISQERINLNGELNFYKSHSYCGALNGNNFSNSDNTAGFIYFVRDPRSVAISLSNHNYQSLEKTVEMMLNEKQFMRSHPEDKNSLLEFFSSWKVNYLSWKNSKYPKLIIKYEELKKNPFDNFKKILTFISQFKKIVIDDEKIYRIIKKCEFGNLQNQEKKRGFKERQGRELFFRKGIINEWRDNLPSSLRELLEENFYSEMQELGYL